MIRSVLFYTVILLATIYASLLAFFAGLISRKSRLIDFACRSWARLILKSGGITTSIEGTENLDPDDTYVFVANHQSWTDIFATIDKIPARIRMIAKKELFRIPLFGWALWMSGSVSIDRKNRAKSIKSIEKAINHIKKYGFSIMLYPEGTRNTDGEMLPFKKGAFVLAIKLKMKIVPVTILGSREVLPKYSTRVKPGNIHMIINPPLDTTAFDYKDRKDLLNQVENTIRDQFYSYKQSADDENGKSAPTN